MIKIPEPTPQQRANGTPLIRCSRGIGHVLRWTLTDLDLHGRENIPMTGGVLFAANHTHLLDGPLLFAVIPRPVSFYVKAEVFIGPFDPFFRRIGQIPVHRGVAERAPLMTALDTLAADGAVGVFPEGTRGTGDVSSVQHGIAYLAVRSGVPVVPVACVGSSETLKVRLPWRRPTVRIEFGKPVQIPASGGRASRHAVADAAERIRQSMAALLAEASR